MEAESTAIPRHAQAWARASRVTASFADTGPRAPRKVRDHSRIGRDGPVRCGCRAPATHWLATSLPPRLPASHCPSPLPIWANHHPTQAMRHHLVASRWLDEPPSYSVSIMIPSKLVSSTAARLGRETPAHSLSTAFTSPLDLPPHPHSNLTYIPSDSLCCAGLSLQPRPYILR
jgi:hypothetical protein